MVLSAGIDGFLNPLVTPAHVIALTGLAVVAGGVSRHAISASVAIIAAFALGLAIGLGVLAWGAGEAPAGDALLAAALLCGLAAASGVAMPVAVAALVALMSGIALGLDSPPDAITLGDAVAMMIGVACSGVAALTLMALVAARLARWRQAIALRVAGSWIAAIAIMALAVRWATEGL
jgi:urease accessory protein